VSFLDLTALFKRMGRAVGIGVMWVALASCQQLGTYQNTRAFAPAPSLSGSRVYVYSFLDLNRDVIGYKLLRDLDPRLISGFSAASLEAKLAMPSYGALEQIKTEARPVSSSSFSTAYSTPIPVDAILSAHAEKEKAFGANYRLLILPSETTTYGTTDGITRVGLEGGAYVVRWYLVDTASNRIVWQTEYSENNSGHKNDRFEERAQNWVDGALEQMRLHRLLPPA
jgi:hypothetical protein